MQQEAECIERRGGGCSGATEYRESLSGTGKPIARCDGHWRKRLREQERIVRAYDPFGSSIPADFDPAYAGESFDE